MDKALPRPLYEASTGEIGSALPWTAGILDALRRAPLGADAGEGAR